MSMIEGAEVFLQEAAELLERLEQALLDLEQTPGNRELVDSAFRALHTIKGSGAMFGFDRVAAFTHGFETAFDKVRKGEISPSRELVAIALEAKDYIRLQIENPDEADARTGERILAGLRAVVGDGTSPEAGHGALKASVKTPPPSAAGTTWRIGMRFSQTVLVNGTNPLLLLGELRDLGPCVVLADTSPVPPLHEMDPEACYVAWTVTLTTERGREAIQDVFIFVMDDMELTIDPVIASGQPEAAPVKPPAEAAAVVKTPEAAAAAAETKPAPVQNPHDEHPAGAPSARAGVGAKDSATIRVQAERLDELMDRVGELVIAQARLSQLAASNHDPNVKIVAEEVERLVSGLRHTTMGIRMVPIGSLFGRFRRLIHDLSRDLGKPVELVTSGEETELDKTMIERLADPLVHLIRNAIDHGLEDQANRATSGKEATGRISLIARHSGAEVLVSVSDDGRGLDSSRIRAKAEEQGLITPGAVIAEADLFQFLFHPGFSTAREISTLSGRGVGMDVVKRTIEGMRGTIDLTTKPGHGTEVTLRLPLTLAIIEGLLVRISDGQYVIPLSSVEECVELSAAADTRSAGRSLFNVRGALIPFLRLRELFEANTPADPHQKIVIVSSNEARVGLVVDQIIGNHQTVIKSLSKLHADVQSFSGATILGDGTVALIFDVPHLIEFGQSREQRRNLSRREAA